jgi:hypothetical protein
LTRFLARLTYDRATDEKTGKDWSLKPIFSEIATAWAVFIATLPDSRKKWVDQERYRRPARRGRPRSPALVMWRFHRISTALRSHCKFLIFL